MSLSHKIRAAWTSLRRSRADRELDEELLFHLEAQIAENLRSGMTRTEAERQARLQLGGEQQNREACREVRMFARLEWFWQDMRFGVRLLNKDRTFTAIAVLTLALGIGVNLAAFNVLNVAAFRPLPVRDPKTLVGITVVSPSSYFSSVPYPLVEWAGRNSSVFASVMAVSSNQLPVGENLQQLLPVEFVTPNYFEELGVGAAYGRAFTGKGDGAATAAPVAILSYGLWERNYGADPSVIGKTIRVNLKPVSIIGIAPFDFAGLKSSANDIWLLLPQHPYFVTGSTLLTDSQGSVEMFARLKPGTSMKTAELALVPVLAEFKHGAMQAAKDERLLLSSAGYAEGGGNGRMKPEEMALAAAFVSFFLLILVVACTNLGNLLLARTVTREREIATRIWIGAGRGRVISQLLTESFLLAVLGTIAGMAFAMGALQFLRVILDMPPRFLFTLDLRLVAFSFGLALVASAAFGLTPAMQALRSGHKRTTARRVLIAVQVAACCVLLVVSGLLVRGMDRALYGQLGFEYKNVMAVDPQLSDHGFAPAAAEAYLESLRTRVASLPGVASVALTTIAPLGNRISVAYIPAAPSTPIYICEVDPAYFQTMSIPILGGRTFQAGEQGVAIVSQTYARKIWPGQNALGQRTTNEDLVIGIAGAARTNALRDGDATELYVPLGSKSSPMAILLVRASGPPESIADAVRDVAIAQNDRVVPTIALLRNSFQVRVKPARDMATVVGTIGLMATFLSAIGVFGLVAYSVSQRQKEIGIRVALGATSQNVLGLLLWQFARTLVVGVAIGMAVAAGVSQFLRSTLYGLSHLDPVSYAGAATFFVLITAIAALVPARRALRVDPAMVLRHE